MRLKEYLSALVIAGAILVTLPQASLATEKQQSTISVTGTGTVSVVPDLAVISVGVVREAKTAREALDANNKAVAAVLAAMKEKGIAKKDLQTSGFNIQPRYVYPKRQSNGEQPAPKIVAYVVTNNLDVRLREIERTGEMLDLVVTLGVNSGGNVRFMNADTTEIMKKARIAAVKNAVEIASTLATAADVELGSILNISENSSRPTPVPIAHVRAMSVQEAAPSVPIAGGENSYRVNVQMNWEIAQ